MRRELTWEESVAKVESYKEVGIDEIYLPDDKENIDYATYFPWKFVSAIKSGGVYRGDVPTGMDFQAAHPCGLTFKWSIDIEDRGTSSKQLGNDFLLDFIFDVAKLIPVNIQHQFAHLLETIASGCYREGIKWQKVSLHQLEQAESLLKLIEEIDQQYKKRNSKTNATT